MAFLGTIAGLGGATFGGKTPKRQIIMNQGSDKFIFPVTPSRFEIQTSQNNKTVDIIDFGEAMLFGNPALIRLKFSCFFPRSYHEYPFIVGDKRDAGECVELMIKWKEGKKPVRLIITDSPINHMFSIKDFDYDNHDGSKDIYFTLSLIEYKDLNTPPANNNKQVQDVTGLKMRPVENTPPVSTDKIKRSQDILEMSKRAYGSVDNWRSLAANNDLQGLTPSWLDSIIIGKG